MIYLNKKYKKIPKNDGYFIYFIQIGSPSNRLFKIGTTNNLLRRMREHCKYYNNDIALIWYKKVKSKYTTLRTEDSNKNYWIKNTDWDYQKKDRFVIPEPIEEVTIKIKKKYCIPLNCECYETDRYGNNRKYEK